MSLLIKLIANPVAGRRAPEKIRQAEEWFRSRGCRVDLVLTGARGDARKAASAAREEGVDRVVAAGGDGTLNEVVNGLAPSTIPLAFLPLGTTNVFALEADIPFNVEEACRIALEGEVRPVCLGVAGETRFLLMAGVGFDAEVVYGINLRLKRWTGKLAYLVGGLFTLLQPSSPPLEIEDDQGQIHRGYGAIISNGRFYGGRFILTPRASLTEDRLDVCLFLHKGRLRFLGCVAGIASGRLPDPAGTLCFQSRKLSVRGSGAPVQVDGDYLGRLPVDFRSAFGELSMVFPTGARLQRTENG